MKRISSATDRAAEHRKRGGRAGFTLMEVVLALSIVGMLATLAVPYFRPGVGVAVMKAKASEIAGLLRRDRNAVLRFGGSSKVSIDIESGIVSSPRLHESVRMPKGMTLRLVPERAEGVTFQTDGRSSGARIVLASSTASIVIAVNRVTSAVGISEIDR